MKIASLCNLLAVCSVSAAGYAQELTYSINKQNSTMIEVFKEIEKNSDFTFFYNDNNINVNQEVSVSASNAPIEEILSEVLENTNYSYKIIDKQILIQVSESENTSVSGIAQSKKKVSGKVIDSTGMPVIGANVIEKGTSSNGTITDLDGNFSLEVGENAVLVVSYIGYTNQEIKVGKNSTVSVTLKEDTETLDEVVVVGYGTTTKRAMIASVSSVKTDELGNLPISNVSQGLAGRAAGLIIQGSGGGLNKVPTISIRGGGTPLVVIDGVIRGFDDFYLLSPDDIESMSVLKDASATAVYGSRAADGILQVTTKKGTQGKPQINYSFSYSISSPLNWLEPLDTWVRADYANKAYQNDGLPDSFSQERIQKMKDGSDPLQNSNTNWRDLILKKTAPMSKHQVIMTGGSDINNYYMSLGHINQGSLYKNDVHNMRRTNFRLSQSSLIKDIGLKVTSTLDGYVQSTKHPYNAQVSEPWQTFMFIQNITPLVPGYNKYGLPFNYENVPTTIIAKDGGYIKDDNKMVNGNLQLEWSLPWVKGLRLRAAGNYRYKMRAKKSWRKDAAKYNWDSKEPVYPSKPKLTNETWYNHAYNLQFFAYYDGTFRKNSLSVLAGYEQTYGYDNYYWLSRENYKFNNIDQIGAGPEGTQKNGGGESEYGRAGWIGQIKYNFDNKYFIEGSIRYDGSDNFPANKRWGAFYSGSVGWSIADEPFMQWFVEKNVFNQLKIRTSYGQVGLDNWGNDDDPFHIKRFEYLNSYILNNKSWVVNGEYVPGFAEGAIPSPDISWFSTDQFDVGFDFSSLNNRLYGSLDYFYYMTKGFLYAPNQVDVGYTDPMGMKLPRIKTKGEHRRAGFDFTLGWRDNIGDFKYDVSMNFTRFDQLWANNPTESVSDLMNPYKRNTQQKGFHSNMYKCEGFYDSAEDVIYSPKRLGSYHLTAGDLKYNDFNGDGKIDDADKIRLGKNSFPRGNFGINIKLNYKGFFFSTLFQGATKFDMYMTGTAQMHGGQVAELPVIYDFQTDYWTPDNRDAKYPRLMSSPGLNGANNHETSDFWLINGAYLRMKDFQFGYDFKYKYLKNIPWISTAVLSVSGQNLFTISQAAKYGLDPENASTEQFDYPIERVFAVSLNIGF